MQVLAVYVITCAILSGCKSSRITGKYEYKQPLVVHQLFIAEDSTFMYHVYGCLSNSESKGNWKIDKSSLFLKSLGEYRPIKVMELNEEHISGIKIHLKDEYGLAALGNAVALNHSQTIFQADTLGFIHFTALKDTVSSFTIFGVNGIFVYDIKNIKSNYFEVTYSTDISKFYLDNEKYVIRNNRLVKDSSDLILKKIRK